MTLLIVGDGTIRVSTLHLPIPFLLYFSKSVLTGKKGIGEVYTIHITPFFAFAVVIPEKKK